MNDRTIQISLSIALIVSIFSVAGVSAIYLSDIAHETTRTRATLEKHIYGAVQNDPNY